jgi:oligopeptide/dipeptide ABC transporter ATP-binding protein
MTLLRVEDLHTWFRSDRGTVRAVNGVSFALDRGRTLGIVGESGSGKSVLIRSVMGLRWATNIARSDGAVWFDGVDLRSLRERQLRAMWGRRISMVFQDPMTSLNPVMKVNRQVAEVLRYRLGMDKAAARRRTVELLASVGIPDPARRADEYPHQLSGGMRQRVTIAIALAGEPDLLIADEPTTALDVTVQAQILALLQRLQRERSMALIVVTHDLGVATGIADEIAVMYAGKVVERAPAEALVRSIRMPYTEALLRSRPLLENKSHTRLAVIPGRPPSMVGAIPGCPFHPRCAYARDRCKHEEPPLIAEREGHEYACWYPVDTSPAEPAPEGASRISTATRTDGG